MSNLIALGIHVVFGTKFSWNEGIDACFNVEFVLLMAVTLILLVVTARCQVVTAGYCCSLLGGYCSLPGGYCSLLVVAARYRLLVPVPTFSMNGEKVVIRTLAKLIEKLEAALPGIQHGRLYL